MAKCRSVLLTVCVVLGIFLLQTFFFFFFFFFFAISQISIGESI